MRRVGTIKKVGPSTWEASVPRKRGLKSRKTARFANEADAKRWIELCNQALDDGEELPDPNTVRALQRQRALTLGQAYRCAREMLYDQHAGSSIEAARKFAEHWRHIEAHFGPDAPIAELNYRRITEFAGQLVGSYAPGKRPATRFKPQEASLVTVREATEITGRSKATINRLRRENKFPGAVQTSREGISMWHIPTADLVAAGLFGRPKPKPLSAAYASDILITLRRVLQVAVNDGHLPSNPAAAVKVPKPPPGSKPPQRKRTMFTYERCAELMEQLHPHHQLVFVIQVASGLRVAEAFGLTPASLELVDGVCLAKVTQQAGKMFWDRDDDGNPIRVNIKKIPKTSAGHRTVPIPPMASQLVHTYLEAYHQDPGTDAFDPERLLVCSLQSPTAGGIAGYRESLNKALHNTNLRQGLGSTHWMRSTYSGLLNELGVDPALRSHLMGHETQAYGGGAPITFSSYTPFSNSYKRLLEVGHRVDEFLQSHVGSFFVPTRLRPTIPETHPEQRHRETCAEEVWSRVGVYEIPTDTNGDPLITLAEAADITGLAVSTLRRWAREGVFETSAGLGLHGRPTQLVALGDVTAAKDDYERRSASIQDLARELNISYRALYGRIQAGTVPATRDPDTGNYIIPAEAIERLRLEASRLQELARRAMTVQEASRALRVAPRSIRALITSGVLEVDPETDSRSRIYITRDSIDRYDRSRALPHGHGSNQNGWMPLKDAAGLLGLDRAEVSRLANCGAFQLKQIRNTIHVKADEVTAYLITERNKAAG